MRQKLHNLKEWYETYERPISTGSLLFGFIFDSLTLQRIDSLLDNLWFLTNLLVAAICIIFLNKVKHGGHDEWKHFWLINVLQFSFGALLGGFFIFYFRSSALATAWPFLLIILLAMVANELFQKRYARLAFQLSFFYLAVFSFAIYLLPLAFHRLGALIFILSGIVSLGVMWFFLKVLNGFLKEKFLENKTHIWSFIGIIFVGVNVLYFTNLIPPIPLALKDIDVYHSIIKNADGDYVVRGEGKGFMDYLRFHERVHWSAGSPLYAYSAIFAPGAFNTEVVHEWQYKNSNGGWTVSTRIPISISGGRDDGFRTYSTKYNLSSGLWRVNVETPRGQLLGRKTFEIIVSEGEPVLETEVKK